MLFRSPRVEQDDLLALVPSVYPDDSVLNAMVHGGALGAYNNNLGSGAGLWWKSGLFSLAANYIAYFGDNADASQGGIATAGSQGSGTLQLGLGDKGWGLAASYSWVQGGLAISSATPLATAAFATASHTDSYGLSGFWQPITTG